ncbi:MAG: DNA primase [Nitrospirae bacterium CG_4_10_14_0_8_um_filter_41_23]|nr:MAG: DNA primase [Nitrospirae bacterium CG2_30_41_42]PIV42613.1 MAG: DNA primase [Nitrospirae bacterium CG02_land_8_20_14_3_00_41_53]PIW87180.1 MAG: DNA primase [Nitrospirae bacterium CG_4_8_14_3_um_filter_41_47]PIY86378.1 MAG: DNA primase [Nitrospirae bacterium CG_4_10_14_0_8_um_filter_41_23]PJA79508.1 MAG: DNA primase [Nitrospirae bacterium CG_4_9_14_3_um_filter_41_27]
MKTERLLEEIKSRIDIVDFISDYVQLKKSGQNYKGLCPFHSEKTPSFMVNQAKQIFHCFGCGIGGDVISFLMKHDNLSFNEATRYIAKKAGIEITEPRFDKGTSERREKILHIQSEAMKFFIRNLKSSESAQTYLKNRGVNETSIDSFHIGYATNEWDALFKYLKNRGYTDSLIKDAGLAVASASGGEKSYRDVFRGRIIFPIFNLHNDVIAFGGRVMDDSMPKYLNSPETEIFKKGDTLFAINSSKDEIRKKGYAIIVEGYLDAIVCRQYGFKNTVAPLGTALTLRQLHRLKLLAKKVVLVFDGDEAGISAARRSLSIVCESDFRARILLLPEGEDPDSFLRKNGSQPFKKMLSDTVSMIEFLLNTSVEDRIDNVREALGMIAVVKDLIIADEMLGELADRSRINESVLRSELKKIKRKPGLHTAKGFEPARKTLDREEYLLLSAIITFPEKADNVIPKLDIEDLKDETIRSIFKKIKTSVDKLNVNSLLIKSDDTERALITELSLNPGFDLEHVDRNINDCLRRIAQRRFEERGKLALSKEPDDAALHNSLLKEKRRLIKEAHL